MHGTKGKPTVANRAFRIFSEIALNDKGGESLDKGTNLYSQRTVPPGTKRFHYELH